MAVTLETLVASKVNTSVLVNGNKYDIDGDGLIKDLPQDDADKLLQNPNWLVWTGESQRNVSLGERKARAAIKLIDSAGSEVEGQKEEAAEEEVVDEEILDPSIPEEGEEWADPDPKYSMDWLRACADAYNVKYAKNIGAEKLVEKIKAEMYD